mmetsp:Transcript_17286/g.50232  ORF Transcript_17286/g.50232 Transcript_17286/m.50232 type:complete len:303 (-) Transcript_17286:431-1339(-)
MGGYLGLVPHEAEHVDHLLIEIGNGDLTGVDIPPVPPPRGRHPQARPALPHHPQHGRHGQHVLLLLDALHLWVSVDVLLGVDAEEVAAHGEGDGERVGRDLVPRDVSDLGPLLPVSRLLEEAREDLRIGLGLMIREEDDVLPRLDLREGLLQVVRAEDDRVVDVHGAAEEVAPEFVVIVGVAILQVGIPSSEGRVLDAEGVPVRSHAVLHAQFQRLGKSGGRLLRSILGVARLVRVLHRREVLGREVLEHMCHGGSLDGRDDVLDELIAGGKEVPAEVGVSAPLGRCRFRRRLRRGRRCGRR